MRISNGVDNPEKVLVWSVLMVMLTIGVWFGFSVQTDFQQRISPAPRSAVKTEYGVPNVGRLAMTRNPFAWGKVHKASVLTEGSPLTSLDVRTLRLVGTAVDEGGHFAWISPRTKTAPILRVGQDEAVGQGGWRVAKIHAETLCLKRIWHGKTEKLVLHLPKT